MLSRWFQCRTDVVYHHASEPVEAVRSFPIDKVLAVDAFEGSNFLDVLLVGGERFTVRGDDAARLETILADPDFSGYRRVLAAPAVA